MMAGRFYIDGKDAWTEYGVYVREGGYCGLAAFPPMKAVDTNDWQEEDGIEPDLSSPRLDTRQFPMEIALSGPGYRYGGFMEKISDKAYHDYDFREIGRTSRLRLVSDTGTELAGLLGFATLELADDFPAGEGHEYAGPESTVEPCGDYELDGRPLTDYGVRVLEGTLDEVKKCPAVKQNLLRGTGTRDGAEYDGERVTFKSKDVKLHCLMRAETPEEFWRNRDALLHDLTKVSARRDGDGTTHEDAMRMLYVDDTGYEYPCYYKGCTVSEFCARGKIWFKFTLTLCFISFRPGDDEYVLATEARDLVVTEDGEHAIDLRRIIE